MIEGDGYLPGGIRGFGRQLYFELAKMFVDTGVACGILNNDTAIQAVVNAYFDSTQTYEPWHGQFMRSVDGHIHHFHVRVKKPDGLCN